MAHPTEGALLHELMLVADRTGYALTEYTEHFYVAYLRDPVGNKVALFCKNPAEGSWGY